MVGGSCIVTVDDIVIDGDAELVSAELDVREIAGE